MTTIRNEMLATEREAELEEQRSRPPNPELDALAKALNGVETDEEMEAIRTVAWAKRVALTCSSCDHVFVDGDIVHRRRVWHDAAPFGWSWSYRSYCEKCVSRWHPSWLQSRRTPQPCAGGCGALVSSWDLDSVRTCSRRCAEIAHKAKRRVVHEERACTECGEAFVPKRSDARFCSTRCRMRAHRAARAS